MLFLLSMVTGYSQKDDYIAFQFDGKVLITNGILGNMEETSGFVKISLDTLNYYVHVHEYADTEICETYYIYSETPEVRYNDALVYGKAEGSTNKYYPESGQKAYFTLWRDDKNNRVAIAIIMNGVSYMYYVNRGIMVEKGATKESVDYNKW